ncbi:MAG: 2-phospho-L-lactate transferase [Solirubrobacteraceae bacterium]
MNVVLLSGGSGGAKLARGLRDLCRLTVIANTGDDIELYGAHVSPDPDLVSYWLADRIDERGWGLQGDTFAVMEGLRELGVDVWFNLGDRDLAVCLERMRLLTEGATLSAALRQLGKALGLSASVVPMSDDPIRTTIRTPDGVIGLQQFLIRLRGSAPIEDVRYEGAADAAPAPAALAAIAAADAIVVGPSNPVISIAPILAVPGIRDAIAAARAPVLAVSPVVGGGIVKGPTAACMQWAGRPCTAQGVADLYGPLLDGVIADESVSGTALRRCETLMADHAARARLAGSVLEFARELSGR